MNQPNPTAVLRTDLTVTVKTRPDGGHYFDQADFAGHVTQWVRAALKDKHAIAEVTITEQPAAASAVVSSPTDRAALRERIAAKARTVRLRLGPNALAVAQRGEPIILNLNEADDLADAVLAVLGEQADRAAEERDRYRTAWRSAQERAQAHAEGTLRHVADRDFWKRQYNAEHARHVAVVGALVTDRAAVYAEALRKGADAVAELREATDVNVAVYPRYDARQKSALHDAERELRRLAVEAHDTGTQQQEDRAAVLLEAADVLPDADLPFVSPMGRRQTADWLRRLAVEAQQPDGRCPACGHTVCDGDGPCGARSGDDFCTCPGPAPVAQQPAAEAEQDDTMHACPGRWGGPNCRCFDAEPAPAEQQAAAADGEETRS